MLTRLSSSSPPSSSSIPPSLASPVAPASSRGHCHESSAVRRPGPCRSGTALQSAVYSTSSRRYVCIGRYTYVQLRDVHIQIENAPWRPLASLRPPVGPCLRVASRSCCSFCKCTSFVVINLLLASPFFPFISFHHPAPNRLGTSSASTPSCPSCVHLHSEPTLPLVSSPSTPGTSCGAGHEARAPPGRVVSVTDSPPLLVGTVVGPGPTRLAGCPAFSPDKHHTHLTRPTLQLVSSTGAYQPSRTGFQLVVVASAETCTAHPISPPPQPACLPFPLFSAFHCSVVLLALFIHLHQETV